MTNIRRILSVGALALAYVGVSAANTITYNASFGPATTDFSNGVMSLTLFDPTAFGGATLTGVTLTLGVTDTITSLELTNTAPGSQSFRFFSQVVVDDIGGGPSNSPTDTISIPTLNVFDTGNIVLGGTSTAALCPVSTPSATCNDIFYTPPNRTGSASNSLIVPGGNIANYLGNGSFTITGETLTLSTFSGGGGNIQTHQTTTAQLFASVTYTYNPPSSTPEPATMLLMGSALVGVGLLRKKIKS